MMMSLIISSRRRGGELISFHAGLAQVRRGFLRGPFGIRASLRGLAFLFLLLLLAMSCQELGSEKSSDLQLDSLSAQLVRSPASCRATIKRND